MRYKALQDPSFPNEALVKEFLEKKDNMSCLNLKWKKPDVVKFIVKFESKSGYFFTCIFFRNLQKNVYSGKRFIRLKKLFRY